jgi:hypothetical protein
MAFEGFGGAAIGADAERVVAVHLHQVGGLVEDVRDCFIVQEAAPERDCNASDARHVRNKKPGLLPGVSE